MRLNKRNWSVGIKLRTCRYMHTDQPILLNISKKKYSLDIEKQFLNYIELF